MIRKSLPHEKHRLVVPPAPAPLHQTSLQLRFLVLHRLIFLAAIVLLLAGCASGLGDTSSSQSANTVPGEKVQDDRFVPAASPGASGKVHW